MHDIWEKAEQYRKERDKAYEELNKVGEIIREMFDESTEFEIDNDIDKCSLLEKYIYKLNKAINNL